MIDFALDTNDNMTLTTAQQISTVTQGAEVAQACKIALRAMKGEYFLDKRYGTDHIGELMARPQNAARVDREIRRVLATVAGVRSVKSVTSETDRDTRELSIDIEINTVYGDLLVSI